MLGQPQGDCGFSLPLAQLGFQTSHLSERRPAVPQWQARFMEGENILVLGGLSSQWLNHIVIIDNHSMFNVIWGMITKEWEK